jgi:hypothetical protein
MPKVLSTAKQAKQQKTQDTSNKATSSVTSAPLLSNPDYVMQLQRTIGNQAVQKMVKNQTKPTIQRMPTRNQVIRTVGLPSGGASGKTQRFMSFLTSLNVLDDYVMQNTLAANRTGVMDQFKMLDSLYGNIATAAEAYYDNLGFIAKKSDRAKYVKSLIPVIAKEKAQLVPIMMRMIDMVGKYNPPPKLFIVLSANQNIGGAVQLNKANSTGSAGGAMNQVNFYDEGVFKAPKMNLSTASLQAGDNSAAMVEGTAKGMKGSAADNEYWIAGQDLRLKGTDNLANREVAMSYLDRLLGAGMIVRTEKALEKDGVNTRSGVVMQNAGGQTGGEFVGEKGKDATKNNAFMQGMSKLQLLDVLALQIDRHQGNYKVITDDSGTVKGVMGFDHDMSFGRRDGWVQGSTKEIPGLAKYVDRQLAQAIVDLDPGVLKMVMSTLLEPDVVEALLARLAKLKAFLQENMDKWLNPTEWETAMNNPDFKDDKSYFNKINN